jgi:hypothetical protein
MPGTRRISPARPTSPIATGRGMLGSAAALATAGATTRSTDSSVRRTPPTVAAWASGGRSGIGPALRHREVMPTRRCRGRR